MLAIYLLHSQPSSIYLSIFGFLFKIWPTLLRSSFGSGQASGNSSRSEASSSTDILPAPPQQSSPAEVHPSSSASLHPCPTTPAEVQPRSLVPAKAEPSFPTSLEPTGNKPIMQGGQGGPTMKAVVSPPAASPPAEAPLPLRGEQPRREEQPGRKENPENPDVGTHPTISNDARSWTPTTAVTMPLRKFKPKKNKNGRKRDGGLPKTLIGREPPVNLDAFHKYLAVDRNVKKSSVKLGLQGVKYLYSMLDVPAGMTETAIMTSLWTQSTLREMKGLPCLDAKKYTTNKIANALDLYLKDLVLRLDESGDPRDEARHIRLLQARVVKPWLKHTRKFAKAWAFFQFCPWVWRSARCFGGFWWLLAPFSLPFGPVWHRFGGIRHFRAWSLLTCGWLVGCSLCKGQWAAPQRSGR